MRPAFGGRLVLTVRSEFSVFCLDRFVSTCAESVGLLS
jgi:hypothetical protein